MFSREEFEVYAYPKSRSPYQSEVLDRVDRHLWRPLERLKGGLYVLALKESDETVQLAKRLGLTDKALDLARSPYAQTIEAIDYVWRTVAFADCTLVQSGTLTLVVSDDRHEHWLFGQRLCAVRSATIEVAKKRAALLEAGKAAIEEARLDMLRTYEHVGQDDHTIGGIKAHELVAQAVQCRLLDWPDAEWWWPWQFPERCPAAADRNFLSDDPFASSDADA